MAERWRPIPGYDGLYDVSTLGNVRTWAVRKGFPSKRVPSDTPQPMHPSVYHCKSSQSHNLMVTLTAWDGTQRRVRIKNLMRDVWLQGLRPGYGVVCKDKDPSNCALHNLAYVPINKTNKYRRSQYNRMPVCKIRAASLEVVDVYPSIRAAAKANYISLQGMRHRIDKRLVCDGYIYRLDNTGGE